MSLSNKILSIPGKISDYEELYEYYKEVCDLREKNKATKSENVLSEKLSSVKEDYEKTTSNISKVCGFLNESTNEILKGRSSQSVILVGNQSAPLIVSLKQLTDDIYKNGIIDTNVNTEEILQDNLSKAEDNLHVLEDELKSTNRFIANLEFLMKYFRKTDRNISTEISSFSDKDVVTSSPINRTEPKEPLEESENNQYKC